MSKSAPPAPDYTQAAKDTAASSAEVTQSQTYANRPTINTPWSNTNWATKVTTDPSTGKPVNQWTMNETLNPTAQNALDSQLKVQSGVSSTAAGLINQNNSLINAPVDWSKFTPTGAAPTAQTYQNPQLNGSLSDSTGGFANKAADAAWQQYNQRNQPIQQTQQDNLRTQLYNSGLKEGDPGYEAAMKRLSQNQGDQNTQASLAATQTGIQGGATMQQEDLAAKGFSNSAAEQNFNNTLQAGQQTFGQQTTAANYQNQVRQQQISEDLQKRGFTLNEINALLTGQQVTAGQQPGFNAAAASQPVNYSNAAAQQYSAAMDASNASNANISGAVGAVGSVAGIAL